MKLQIIASSNINPNGVYANEKLVFKNAYEDFGAFSRAFYRDLDLKYSKFYKMDELCQLAFLGAELLMEHMQNDAPEKVALVLGNRHSSLSSDSRHYKTITDKENYFPSPSVFVYTLPNIMLGELCIRHKFTGENSCFLMEGLDREFLHEYVTGLFKEENYQYCITGFVDYTHEAYLAQLFLIRNEQEGAVSRSTAREFTKEFKSS